LRRRRTPEGSRVAARSNHIEDVAPVERRAEVARLACGKQLGQPPMLRTGDFGRSERHEREPMCSTGERLGPRRQQERTHRPGEQEPGRTTLAIDDALDVGEHLRGAMELVDRHEPRRCQRGTDVLTSELEHAVIVEVDHERVPSMGDRGSSVDLPDPRGPSSTIAGSSSSRRSMNGSAHQLKPTNRPAPTCMIVPRLFT